MIKGKTVKLRHKPVLAVCEGCGGWERCSYLLTWSGFVTGETREGGCGAG